MSTDFHRSAARPHRSTFAKRRPYVALMLAVPGDEKLWRTALASQEVSSVDANLSEAPLAKVLRDHERLTSVSALIVDAPLLHAAGLTIERLAEWIARGYPGLALFVRLPWRTRISAGEQSWATRAGVAGLLCGDSAVDWSASLAPSLALVLRHLGRPGADMAKLEKFLRVLVAQGEEPRPGIMKDAWTAAHRLEMQGVDSAGLLAAMRGPGGVAVADRRYRATTYRQCFVASEALDWLEARGLPRHAGLAVGDYLGRTGRIHHVLREHGFSDANLFFRFGGDEPRLDRLDLHEVRRAMGGPGGLAISSRSYLGKTYARAFVGSDCVDFLRSRYRLSVGEAEAIGQRLVDVGVIHHVCDEHGFSDAGYYYRFRADDDPSAAPRP